MNGAAIVKATLDAITGDKGSVTTIARDADDQVRGERKKGGHTARPHLQGILKTCSKCGQKGHNARRHARAS